MSALAVSPLPFSPYGQPIIAQCATGTANPLVLAVGVASIVMPIRNLVQTTQWFNLVFTGWLSALTNNTLTSCYIILYTTAACTTEITRVLVPQPPAASSGTSVRFTTSEMVLVPGGVANGIFIKMVTTGSAASIYNSLDTGAQGLGVYCQPIGPPIVP